jgi:phosphoglycerate kinase
MSYIPGMMEADLFGKVVLVRLDHNVVKKGKIKDPMRIDATIPTLLHIFKKGGLPVLMSHVGRPYDKTTGQINISELEGVEPIVEYLSQKLQLRGLIPELKASDGFGIAELGPLGESIARLKHGECDFVYLPNTGGSKAKKPRTSGRMCLPRIWQDMRMYILTMPLAVGSRMPAHITLPSICLPLPGC